MIQSCTYSTALVLDTKLLIAPNCGAASLRGGLEMFSSWNGPDDAIFGRRGSLWSACSIGPSGDSILDSWMRWGKLCMHWR